MKESVLFLFWHGNGDCVMAINSFKAYKEKFPNVRVGVATLKNRGSVPVDLLSPVVDDVFPLLSEPWDWPEKLGKSLLEGRYVAQQEGKDIAKEYGYEDVVEITMSHLMSTYKAERVAMEIGVYPLDNYIPIIEIPDKSIEYAKNFVGNLQRPITFFHCVGADFNKTLLIQDARDFVRMSGSNTIIECGSDVVNGSVLYKPENVYNTCGLIRECDSVFCIDSLVMHLSVALGADTNVLFTKTTPRLVFGNKVPDNVKVYYRGN